MNKLFVWLSAVTILFVSGCTLSDGDEIMPGNSVSEESKIEIADEYKTLNFLVEGGDRNILFSSSHDWTAILVGGQPNGWCTVSRTSGDAGLNTIKIHVQTNNTYDDRTASVQIKSGSASVMLVVTQKQKNALTVTQSKFEIGADGGDIQIELKSNVDIVYQIQSGASDWIHVWPAARAMTSTWLAFHIDENKADFSREGKIVFFGNGLSETVSVYQIASPKPFIDVAPNAITLPAEAQSFNVKITSNVDVAYSISPANAWITPADDAGRTFNVAENTTDASRSASITFYNTNAGVSSSLSVTQEPHEVTGPYEPSSVPNNEIHYISSDGNVVVPLINGFGDAILRENTYYPEKGYGIMVFDRPVTEIGIKAFYNYSEDTSKNMCENLLQIYLPNTISQIGNLAFYRCSNLKSIKLPYGITTLAGSLFSHCVNLEVVDIPSSVTTIDGGAFCYCRSLNELEIPEGVQRIIGSHVFAVSGLKSITLPSSVKVLEIYALHNGSAERHTLEHVYLKSINPPDILNICSDDVIPLYKIPVLHVPANSIAKYRNYVYHGFFYYLTFYDNIVGF